MAPSQWANKFSYQQDHGNVQAESDESVGDQGEDTQGVDSVHGQTSTLNEDGEETVDDGASGGVVVDRDKGVHLELGAAEQTLNHDKTHGLGDNTSNLHCTGAVSNSIVSRVPTSDIPRKPNISNLSSPKEAMITPITMIETFRRTFMLGAAMPKTHVAIRVAAAFVAYSSPPVRIARL
jgi:hypothetical protein